MPQLPIPAATGDVWGNTLNNFLKQISPSTGGGINFGTTRPTTGLTDGFTMVDTSVGDLIRWNGSTWDILILNSSNILKRLSADLDLFVATNGNDSNNGLSSSSPFLTIQKAIDTAYTYFLGDYAITIKVAPGTYPSQAKEVRGKMPGQKIRVPLRIVGTGSNPSDTVFQQGTDLAYNFAAINADVFIKNIKFNYTGSTTSTSQNYWNSVHARTDSNILIDEIDFGPQHPTKGYHLHAFGGKITNPISGEFFTGSTKFTISGGCAVHAMSQAGGGITIACNNGDVNYTFINNPTISTWTLAVSKSISGFFNGDGLTLGVYNILMTGNKTVGTKWFVSGASTIIIGKNNSNVSYIPGANGNTPAVLLNDSGELLL